MKLFNHRKLYEKDSLSLDEIGDNPIDFFKKWFKEAEKSDRIVESNAMTVSTVDESNKPSSRVVLLKSYDENGFIFYTNSNSKKGKSIKANNNVALNFHWKSQNRQIRIEGKANIVDREVADKYFKSRPRGSQIGAWSSNQSKELTSRKELIDNIKKNEKKYEGLFIPRPSYWNGYLVTPQIIEFWKEMPFRIHDRLVFNKFKNKWKLIKLYP